MLLILAGVAILILSGENGILKQAANAKTQTEKKTTIEAMKLVGISALTAGNGDIKKAVKGELFAIKDNGEVVHLSWWYTDDGKQIINGKQTLTLGDKIKYDPTEGLTADSSTGVYKEYKSVSTKNGNSDQTFTLYY